MNMISSTKIVNSYEVEILFVLEPWGEQYKMQPKASFIIVASAPSVGQLDIQIQEKRITIFGWTGSTVQLFQDGTEVGGSNQPVPALPKK